MTDTHPHFASPPVAETAISVQFDTLSAYMNPHAGWYWHAFLGVEDWPTVQVAPPIEDQFERFGDDMKWKLDGPTIDIREGTAPDRTMFWSTDNQTMVQIQPSRFILNWRKGDSPYPTFDKLRLQFTELFDGFRRFVSVASLGEIRANQWEVTRVNPIPTAELWAGAPEWNRVIRRFSPLVSEEGANSFERCRGEWRFILPNEKGRLYVAVRSGRFGGPDADDSVIIQLTARGPIDPESADGLGDDLEQARCAINSAFVDITDPELQTNLWGRSQ